MELAPPNATWARLSQRDGKWHLILTYKLIPTRGFFAGCSDNTGNLSIIANSFSKSNSRPWWVEWSTQEDCLGENAGKTLYLEKLSRIIEEPLKKKYESGRITMRINRP